MADFLRSWRTSIVALLAVIIGILGQMFPGYLDLINQINTFLIGVLAFFAKDASTTGTTSNPR